MKTKTRIAEISAFCTFGQSEIRIKMNNVQLPMKSDVSNSSENSNLKSWIPTTVYMAYIVSYNINIIWEFSNKLLLFIAFSVLRWDEKKCFFSIFYAISKTMLRTSPCRHNHRYCREEDVSRPVCFEFPENWHYNVITAHRGSRYNSYTTYVPKMISDILYNEHNIMITM